MIEKIHEEIRHFGELWTFAEIIKRFFWHDKMESIRAFVKTCDKSQLAKQFYNMRFGSEEMKSIPICDLFYHVVFAIVGPLVETINGNKYVLMAIDQYSKWCETRPIKEHDVFIVSNFLEYEVICKYGVLKYILTNNGNEWMKECVEMCRNYGIIHQFTTLA